MTEALPCALKSKACWRGGVTRFLSASSRGGWLCSDTGGHKLLGCCSCVDPSLRFLLFHIKPKPLGIISMCCSLPWEDGIVKTCGKQTQGAVRELWIRISCVFIKVPLPQKKIIFEEASLKIFEEKIKVICP